MYNRSIYHEPGDRARTTIKETTSDNTYNGILNPQNSLKQRFHQPGDRANNY